MSNAIQTCPGCDSFILSDTYECPECGHIFDQSKAEAARAAKKAREEEQRKFNQLHDPCPNCGEMVRTGLVRCWKCNAFMRQDVADRYRSLTSNPQQIIFSDIPAEQRTEFIPARADKGTHGRGYGSGVFDAVDDDEDEFTLDARTQGPQDAPDEFELDAAHQVPRTADSAAAPTDKAAAGPDQPRQKTPGQTDAAADQADTADKASDAEAEEDAAAEAAAAAKVEKAEKDKAADIGAEDLLGIALKEQRELRRRRRERLAEAKRKRILIPCACGAWVRVSEDQSGRTVRCRQCKQPLIVPEIKKREKPAAAKKEAVPEIRVDWLEDVRLHILNPTDLVLKPGSLESEFTPVDVGFHDSGLQLIKFAAAPKKKSLFSRGGSGEKVSAEQRTQVREHIVKTGGFSGLPHGELLAVSTEQVGQIRMVQPVAQAHESMFAGVPVFGEGRIAVYLPLTPGENKQAFLSFAISTFRQFNLQLQKHYQARLPAQENGVPATEDVETLSCFLSQARIESLKNLTWYQNDPAFELELSGYKCAACGIAVAEEARAKKKLGGANGKSIAKAKCPKCSSKFGEQPLYRIAKAPEAPEAEDSAATPASSPAAAKPQPGEEAAATASDEKQDS